MEKTMPSQPYGYDVVEAMYDLAIQEKYTEYATTKLQNRLAAARRGVDAKLARAESIRQAHVHLKSLGYGN